MRPQNQFATSENRSVTQLLDSPRFNEPTSLVTTTFESGTRKEFINSYFSSQVGKAIPEDFHETFDSGTKSVDIATGKNGCENKEQVQDNCFTFGNGNG